MPRLKYGQGDKADVEAEGEHAEHDGEPTHRPPARILITIFVRFAHVHLSDENRAHRSNPAHP